jgi:hypothetical protein
VAPSPAARAGQAPNPFRSLKSSLSVAILRHMKVEEIAEAVAKLPLDQLARFRRWFTAFEAGAPITPRNSTLLRLNSAASPAARLLN